MSNHHDHHGHHHHKYTNQNQKVLATAVFITFGFMIIELIGGWITNSLALLSDAGHMLSDAGALVLSLVAVYFAKKPPSPSKTYGYYRFEILAALINGITLFVIAIYIFVEAIQRIITPPKVNSELMMIVAIIGLVANLASAFILMRGEHEKNLNLKSAYLHVVGDALGSIGVIVAGLLMRWFKWYHADPIISVLVSVLILVSAWRVLKDSVNILMEGTPSNINYEQIKQALMGLKGVIGVHDLHIWSISSGKDSLSCHLVIEDGEDQICILQSSIDLLKDKFQIEHTTIQIENSKTNHKPLHCN
ncbi:cation diffusion facilitator family transporter [Tepidibacillus sp. LV47]|uniref:cation diffusion facilitator family transporter n=1 Tax=Tepidibacillus sp. LV47 TaxID=3398228 RepID=UPI003AAF9277